MASVLSFISSSFPGRLTAGNFDSHDPPPRFPGLVASFRTSVPDTHTREEKTYLGAGSSGNLPQTSNWFLAHSTAPGFFSPTITTSSIQRLRGEKPHGVTVTI